MPPKKATKRKKPLKILIYGASGVGKTHFALFATPGKTLVFDMEGGTDLFESRVDFDFWTDDEGFKTQSYREIRKCIDYLRSPEGRQKYETFIVDPVTLIWTLLQQERQDYKEEAVAKKGRVKENETDLESFTTRDWNIVKKMHKSVIDELSALPQNVFLIAREKPVVEMKNGEPVSTGEITYEGEKNTIYAVDFAFRIWVDEKKRKRFAQIKKDRSGTYETGAVIENPTFGLFNDIVNGMADGEETKGVKTDSEGLFSEKPKQEPVNWPAFWTNAKKLGFSQDDVHKHAGVDNMAHYTREQATALYRELESLAKHSEQQKKAAAGPNEKFKQEVGA